MDRSSILKLAEAKGAGQAHKEVKSLVKVIRSARHSLVRLRHTHLTNEPLSKVDRSVEMLYHYADSLDIWQLEAQFTNWAQSHLED